MSADRPKISVCIPAYNQGCYLGLALDSVLRQTVADFEVIVFDDASTDDTQKVVASVSHPRLHYFRHPHNVGIARNRNSCLAVARGQYVAWLDSDDVYHPQMLEVQGAVLDRHPRVGLIHGGYEVIDAEGRRLPDWPLPFAYDVIEPGKEAFRELVLSNYVTAPTVMVRRECYDRVGPYAVEVDGVEDWEMWLRIALHADLAYTAASVAQYRQHGANVSTTTTRSGQRLRRDIRAIESLFAQQHTLIPDAAVLQRRARAALATKALIYAGDLFTLGRQAEALTAVFQGLRLVPSLWHNKHSWLLVLGIHRRDEYANYRHSKALLSQLYSNLAGTRYGNQLQKMAMANPAWEQTLQDIARTMCCLVPQDARVLVADKYDPTLLHLSRHRGWHFPDRRLLPGGYPRDSNAAIEHLEQLRQQDASYIVFPSAAFWWLEYYAGFRQHLESRYARIWHNQHCVIYHLDQPEPGKD
jgi:glycosyltransferase involved in cell wall biosynthesis